MNRSVNEAFGRSDQRQTLLRSPTVRVVLIIAPAGYGKTTAANTLRAEYENNGTCECLESDTIRSFVRSVLLALAQENPGAASFFAELQTRLSSLQADAECITLLDAAWNKHPPRSLFIFENAEAVAAISPVSSLLTRLLNTAPQTRRIVVCSRVPLPTRASRYLPPHLLATVTAADLALTDIEGRAILEREGVDPGHWDNILGIARGWPIVLLLLARLSREGHLQDALSDLSSVAFDDFFIYFLNEVLAPMDASMKRVVTLCAAVPGLTIQELRATSGMSDIEIESIVRKAALIQRDGDGYTVHPLAREILLQNEPDWRNLLLPVARLAEDRLDYRRASHLYRIAGDYDRAAGSLAALSWEDLQIPENVYELTQLPLTVVCPNAKLAAVSCFLQRPDIANQPDILNDIFERLCEADAPDIVAAVAVTYSMAEYNREGDVRRSTAILNSPLVRRAGEISESSKALLEAQEQIIAFNSGTFVFAEDRIRAGYDLSVVAHLPHNSASFADYLAAFKRWRGDREGAVYWQELALAHSRSCTPRVHAARLSAAIFNAWFFGDDDSVNAHYEELAAAEATTREPDYSVALRALDPQTIDSAPLPEIMLHARALVFAASKVGGERRRRLLDLAEARANDRARVLAQVLIARAASDRVARASICDRVASLIRADEMPEFHAAVLAYREGLPSFLDAYTRRFASEPGNEQGEAGLDRAGIYVQLLHECVLIEGHVFRLTPREAALLAFLSRQRSGFSREEIQDALWPDLVELRARDSLYSLLHRLRKRLDKSNIVDGIGNAYRIAGGVQVDLWDIELLCQRVQRETSAGSLDEVRRYYTMIRQREYPHLHRFEWFSPIVFRIHEHARVLARYLVDDALNRADYDAVIEYADELIREDPCDEWAHEVTIRAYLESHNYEKAAEAYETYRTLRKREIAAEPSRRMQELANAINAERIFVKPE